MSGPGERPTDERENLDDEQGTVTFGETLYTEDGSPVGEVRGIDESGVFVTLRDEAEELTLERARSDRESGEADLVWRCTECGETGTISGGLPDACPHCDADSEGLMYWTEN